jgi:hypothetical protein
VRRDYGVLGTPQAADIAASSPPGMHVRGAFAAHIKTFRSVLRREALFRLARVGWGFWDVWMGHSLILRTSPRWSASDFRVIVTRRVVSLATWSVGITCLTASTALAFATAAIQSDFCPSGAMTSTIGILVRTFGMFVI